MKLIGKWSSNCYQLIVAIEPMFLIVLNNDTGVLTAF